jgi:hypothetical protein
MRRLGLLVLLAASALPALRETREVIHEKKSLMPAYASLSQDDLQNLLAYLDSLHGEIKAGADVREAEEIK